MTLTAEEGESGYSPGEAMMPLLLDTIPGVPLDEVPTEG